MQVKETRITKKVETADMEITTVTHRKCHQCLHPVVAWEEKATSRATTCMVAVIQIRCMETLHLHQVVSTKEEATLLKTNRHMECTTNRKWVEDLKEALKECLPISNMVSNQITRDTVAIKGTITNMDQTIMEVTKVTTHNTPVANKIWEWATRINNMEAEEEINSSNLQIIINNQATRCSNKSHTDRAHSFHLVQTNMTQVIRSLQPLKTEDTCHQPLQG